MTNRSASAAGLILACALLGSLVFCSCNSKPKTDAALVATQVAAPIAATATPDLCLASLSITGADFEAKVPDKANVIFNYYLDDTSVTLSGWVLLKHFKNFKHTGDYEPPIKLALGVESVACLRVGPGTAISNQVILGDQTHEILKYIKANPQTILYFKPVYVPASSDTTAEIIYNISATKKSPGLVDILIDLSTMNPSPPHHAYD